MFTKGDIKTKPAKWCHWQEGQSCYIIVYVIEITTPHAPSAPRVTREPYIIGDSVQSTAILLKLHMFRCFQKISLILYNSEHIFCIMYIIKSQTSRRTKVTL